MNDVEQMSGDVAAAVIPAVRRLQFLWAAVFAGNIVFILAAGAIPAPPPGAVDPAGVDRMTSLFTGLGGLIAVSGILVRAQLTRRAAETARSVEEYCRQRLTGMLVCMGMAQTWPVLGLVVRANGGTLWAAVVTTLGGAIACFFHFPFPSDFIRDAQRIRRRTAASAGTGRP